MSWYGTALWVHVVAAIVLVGGSVAAMIVTALLPRARTIDGLRAHVGFLHTFVKATGPIAGIVLVAGLYLAFVGEWWGAGWPVVSLVLFGVGGVASVGLIDPATTRLKEHLDDLADGPASPGLLAEAFDERVILTTWVLAGADAAIVFLMTNKPGWSGSIVAGGVGLTVGAVIGLRRRARAGSLPPTAPAAPA